MEEWSFVGLSLVIEILYTYQTHLNQEVDNGWKFYQWNTAGECRQYHVTWWVNNINYILFVYYPNLWDWAPKDQHRRHTLFKVIKSFFIMKLNKRLWLPLALHYMTPLWWMNMTFCNSIDSWELHTPLWSLVRAIDYFCSILV